MINEVEFLLLLASEKDTVKVNTKSPPDILKSPTLGNYDLQDGKTQKKFRYKLNKLYFQASKTKLSTINGKILCSKNMLKICKLKSDNFCSRTNF